MQVPQSDLLRALEEPYLFAVFLITSLILLLLWLLLLADHVRTRMAVATFRGTSRATAAISALAFPVAVVMFVALAVSAREGFVHEAYLLVAAVCLTALVAIKGWLRSRGSTRTKSTAEAHRTARFVPHLGEALPRWWEGFLGPWAGGLVELGLERLPKHLAGRPVAVWTAITVGFLVGVSGVAATLIAYPNVVGGHPRSVETLMWFLLPITSILGIVQAVALLARATWAVLLAHLWLVSVALVGWVYLPLWRPDAVSRFVAAVVLPAILTLILARCAYAVSKAVFESRGLEQP